MANSKDAKRKKKLAERAKRKGVNEVTPYSGKTYRSDAWQPYVYATEMAIYDTILISRRQLTNIATQMAFETLVRQLRAGLRNALSSDEETLVYSAENIVPYLIQDIRRKWNLVFTMVAPRSASDMVGVLRTLLYSIQAHAANTGSTRGYVDFVWDFIGRFAEPGKPAPINFAIPASKLEGFTIANDDEGEFDEVDFEENSLADSLAARR